MMSKPADNRPYHIGGVNLQEAYFFLDDLRDSGVTNMYGAGEYLQDEYDIDKYEAREILKSWMEDFSQ